MSYVSNVFVGVVYERTKLPHVNDNRHRQDKLEFRSNDVVKIEKMEKKLSHSVEVFLLHTISILLMRIVLRIEICLQKNAFR